MDIVKFIEVVTKADYRLATNLIEEYVEELGTDLSFQNINQELIDINTQYKRPEGVLFLLYENNEKLIGCFGIRRFDTDICELKRMYLRNEARGKGIGKCTLQKAIKEAVEMGYKTLRLDTLPSMKVAKQLYIKAGFKEIESYRFNPIKGSKFFEIKLKHCDRNE